MIARFIAKSMLLLAGLGLLLANYWFTFGLWPQSWTSFVLCGLGSFVLLVCHAALDQEAKS